jgi:hypothetical protein
MILPVKGYTEGNGQKEKGESRNVGPVSVRCLNVRSNQPLNRRSRQKHKVFTALGPSIPYIDDSRRKAKD